MACTPRTLYDAHAGFGIAQSAHTPFPSTSFRSCLSLASFLAWRFCSIVGVTDDERVFHPIAGATGLYDFRKRNGENRNFISSQDSGGENGGAHGAGQEERAPADAVCGDGRGPGKGVRQAGTGALQHAEAQLQPAGRWQPDTVC